MPSVSNGNSFCRFARVPAAMTMTMTMMIAMAFGFASAAARAQSASLERAVTVDIAPQKVSTALLQLSHQAAVQVLMPGLVADRQDTRGVRGKMSLQAAISKLLEGTTLRFHVVGKDVIGIESDSSASRSSSAGDALRLTQSQAETARVPESAASSQSQNPAAAESPDTAGNKIQEIIVTAQKRAEKLMDVPSSISAVSGERLESLQVNSLADLASYVPGTAIMAGGAPGYRSIVLRGINSSYELNTVAASVGTYIDDLPVGGSTAANRAAQYGVDLQPYDIERIEILKGPQGTLYGANTLGGLVKYVLRRPNLTQFAGRAGSDLSYVDGSGGADWAVRASVNLPLVTDKLGVLVSGFEKRAAGYIDNIGTADKDANDSTQRGGRATLLWRATDNLAVRATILADDVNVSSMTAVTVDGTTVRPAFGEQTVNTLFREPYEQQTRSYSLSVDWDLGFAALTSASGWSKINFDMLQDLTIPYGQYCQAGLLGPTWQGCPDYPLGDALTTWTVNGTLEKFVQEVRLTSRDDGRFQWMVGLFYTKEDSIGAQLFPTFTPSFELLPPDNDIVSAQVHGTFKEKAAFANVTYQLTDRFDVSVGGRHSAYSSRNCTDWTRGIFAPPLAPCDDLPSQEVTLWMTNARFRLNPDAMLYVRAATGYRPGGGCEFHSDGTPCGVPALGIPGIVGPDKTTNYEVGYKAQLFDQRLQLDMSVFTIDWSDIQLTLNAPSGFGYPGNGGNAVSRGVELATSYQFTGRLRLNTTLAYTDAHLTENTGPGGSIIPGANVGDQLPVSPRWTGSVTAEYNRPLADRFTLLLGGGYRYRDAIVNSIGTNGYLAPPIGPQNIVDLYAGLAVSNFALRLYGKNVLDNRSYTGALFVNDLDAPRFVPVQPRTIGLGLDYNF